MLTSWRRSRAGTGPVYNPLAEVNLGGNITLAMVTTCEWELSEHRSHGIEGGGVYALYYLGPASPYGAYRAVNLGPAGERRAVAPIYVGSSFAVGIKSGLQGMRGNAGNRSALADRIATHARTISRSAGSAVPLDTADFLYRALPLQQSHIGLAEAALITFFRPVWNGSGFGNHQPGKGRPGHDEPSGFTPLHGVTAGASGNPAVQQMVAQYQLRVAEQVAALRASDPNPDIERFMSLVRLKLGIQS
jgi:hypothetical protein